MIGFLLLDMFKVDMYDDLLNMIVNLIWNKFKEVILFVLKCLEDKLEDVYISYLLK